MSVRTATVAHCAIVAAVAWGVFSFGAVYPWAYWPLAIMAVLAGCLAVAGTGRVRVPFVLIAASGAAFAAAVAFQLVPLPSDVLQRWSPATVETLRRLDLSFAVGLTDSHSITIDPASTVAGLALFVACGILTFGVAKTCSAQGVKWLGPSLTAVAVIVALVGLIQKALFNGKIYGVWEPEMQGNAFGPFVNRNHFAGWMMMVLPITLGALCAGIARGMRGTKPEWRERMLWFGSKDASQIIMYGAAAAVMALSLVMTMSRSGIGAFGLALLINGMLVVFGVGNRARKTVAAVYLGVLFVLIVGWTGLDVIAGQFEDVNWDEFNNRRGAWQDARDIHAMFPLTGVGFGAYGAATQLYQKHDLIHHYAQAHNDYLQLAAEGGLLLIVPAVILALVLTVSIARRFRDSDGSETSWWIRAGAVTGLVAISLQEVVDFSLQMPGNAVLFSVLIGIALHRSPVARAGRIAG